MIDRHIWGIIVDLVLERKFTLRTFKKTKSLLFIHRILIYPASELASLKDVTHLP